MTDAPETTETTAHAVAHRLHIDEHGHLVGEAWITRNDPFPAVNGQMGLTPPMNGVVLHTNVGTLPGTIATFNDPHRQASAHFEVGGPWSGTVKDGQARIHQFGPVNGWMAWHCADGNNMWFGIETEDGGNPSHPLTDAQLTAVAQIVEALSAHGKWGFPLEVTNHTNGHGLGAHFMGGAAWGGHTCPDNPPGGQGPRSHQRGEIIRRAKILREHGQFPAPAKHANPVTGLHAEARYTQVDVTWKAAANATEYQVKAWVGDTREVARETTTAKTSVTLHDLQKGVRYRISVWASPGDGDTASVYVTTRKA